MGRSETKGWWEEGQEGRPEKMERGGRQSTRPARGTGERCPGGARNYKPEGQVTHPGSDNTLAVVS